jgi:protein-tyrosine phosphatase
MGSVKHAMDERLLKNLQVSCLVDAENPRKRSAHAELVVDPTLEVGRVELDDDFSYDEFKSNIVSANKLIQLARADNKTVFVFCTHGNNESAVVCIAYLMVVEQWSLEHAYRHVLQKRPASAPRKTYVEKVRESWSARAGRARV